MSEKDKKQNGDSEYWKYLEENSRVVSNWPDWMRGEPSDHQTQKCDGEDDSGNS